MAQKYRTPEGLGRADRALLLLARILSKRLSVSAQSLLKGELRPTCEMDYAARKLLLHAEDDLDWLRARSCAKEPETVAWLEEHVRPNDVLYDVGANVGAYSMVAATRHPTVTVHAFEPSFSNFERLVRNIFLNGLQQQVTPHPLAIAESTAVQQFNYQSLEAGSALHTLGAALDYRGEPFVPCYRQLMLGVSIDDLVFGFGYPAPTLLKIDVDGTEWEVVKGAARVLSAPEMRTLVVEVGSRKGYETAIAGFLAERGFTLASRHRHNADVVNCVFARLNGP